MDAVRCKARANALEPSDRAALQESDSDQRIERYDAEAVWVHPGLVGAVLLSHRLDTKDAELQQVVVTHQSQSQANYARPLFGEG